MLTRDTCHSEVAMYNLWQQKQKMAEELTLTFHPKDSATTVHPAARFWYLLSVNTTSNFPASIHFNRSKPTPPPKITYLGTGCKLQRMQTDEFHSSCHLFDF